MNTDDVCGEFETPANPDQGQDYPKRLKKDCEAPTIPALSTINYDPDADPKFTV